MNYLWKPSNKLVENSILKNFTKYIGLDFKNNFIMLETYI